MSEPQSEPIADELTAPAPAPEGTFDLSKASPALFEKLIEAQSQLETVLKEAHNSHGGWNYATADSMILAARKVLNAAGLGAMSSWRPEFHDARGSGKQWHAGFVVIDLIVFNAEGAMVRAAIRHAVICSYSQPEDKAAASAVTHGLGFAMRGLLMVDRSEDEKTSVDGRNDAQGEYRPPEPRGRRESGARGARAEQRQRGRKAPAEDPDVLAVKKEFGSVLRTWRKEATAAGIQEPDWREMAAEIMGLESWPANPPISLIRAAIPKVRAEVQRMKDRDDPTIQDAPAPAEDETQAEPTPEPYDPDGFKDPDPTLDPIGARDEPVPEAYDPETGELINEDMDSVLGGEK